MNKINSVRTVSLTVLATSLAAAFGPAAAQDDEVARLIRPQSSVTLGFGYLTDDAIRFGFGIRWSFFGMYMIYHMAGGEAGMKHFLEQFGPALDLPWTHLKAPPLTDDLIDKIVEGTEARAGKHSIKDLERLRDDCIISVINAITEAKAKHGWKYED